MRLCIRPVLITITTAAIGLSGLYLLRDKGSVRSFPSIAGNPVRIVFRPNDDWQLVEITDRDTLKEIMRWLSSMSERHTSHMPVSMAVAHLPLTIETDDGKVYAMTMTSTCASYSRYVAGDEYWRTSDRLCAIAWQGNEWSGHDNPFTRYLWRIKATHQAGLEQGQESDTGNGKRERPLMGRVVLTATRNHVATCLYAAARRAVRWTVREDHRHRSSRRRSHMTARSDEANIPDIGALELMEQHKAKAEESANCNTCSEQR